MYPQVRLYPETRFSTLATCVDDLVADPSVSFMFEDPVLGGDLAYEHLARGAREASDPFFSDWPVYSPSTDCAYTGFTAPPLSMDNLSFSPASSLSSLPQERLSPVHSGRSPQKQSCRQGTPSFNHTQRKWACSACREVFHNKYECERHIGNVGKQVMCLACGKCICARRDNRKRHYTKYCKRMDIGRDGNLGLKDAFIEL